MIQEAAIPSYYTTLTPRESAALTPSDRMRAIDQLIWTLHIETSRKKWRKHREQLVALIWPSSPFQWLTEWIDCIPGLSLRAYKEVEERWNLKFFSGCNGIFNSPEAVVCTSRRNFSETQLTESKLVKRGGAWHECHFSAEVGTVAEMAVQFSIAKRLSDLPAFRRLHNFAVEISSDEILGYLWMERIEEGSLAAPYQELFPKLIRAMQQALERGVVPRFHPADLVVNKSGDLKICNYRRFQCVGKPLRVDSPLPTLCEVSRRFGGEELFKRVDAICADSPKQITDGHLQPWIEKLEKCLKLEKSDACT